MTLRIRGSESQGGLHTTVPCLISHVLLAFALAVVGSQGPGQGDANMLVGTVLSIHQHAVFYPLSLLTKPSFSFSKNFASV